MRIYLCVNATPLSADHAYSITTNTAASDGGKPQRISLRRREIANKMQDDCVVRLPSTPLCVSSHGTEALLALGLAEGGIAVAKVDGLFSSRNEGSPSALVKNDRAEAITKATHQVPSTCLTTAFQPGSTAFFAGTEGTVHLFDIERPKPLHLFRLPPVRNEDATGAERKEVRTPSTVYSYDSHTVVVGDDDGGIHLYDTRVTSNSSTSGCVAEALDQGDYISSLHRVERFGTCAILATSGDGTLCAYDVRRLPTARVKLQYAFDKFDDDILSLGIVECSNGEAIGVAGTLCGMLNLYNMNFMDVEADPDVVAHVDRFAGHPECVNSVLTCPAADIAVTASSDGFVRVVDVVSKTLIGVLDYCDKVGDSEETGGDRSDKGSLADVKLRKRKRKKGSSRWPIEAMVHVNGASTPALALICHDEYVRFCDASPLTEEDDEKDDEQREGDNDVEGNAGSANEEGEEDSLAITEPKVTLSLPPEAELLKRNKRGKKKKKNGANETTGQVFFADL